MMKFTSRLKKEMSEGVVRAVLEHAGYRVTDFGIEKTVPGLNRLSKGEYQALGLPTAVKKLPDFIVLAGDEQAQQLVEVKYRQKWGVGLLRNLRKQVECFGEIVLVSINASADNPNKYKDSPARYLRCCRLRFKDGVYEAELYGRHDQHGRKVPGFAWYPVKSLRDSEPLWWQMSPLRKIFSQLGTKGCQDSLRDAVKAISGLFPDEPDTPQASETPKPVTPSKSVRSKGSRVRSAKPTTTGTHT